MPGPTFIRGETVELRPLEPADADFLRAHKNDRRVWKPTGWPWPATSQGLEDWIGELHEDDGVHLLATVDGDPVGKVDLFDVTDTHGTGEVGYWIAPDHQGAGYGSEAVSLLVDHAFAELRLHRIEAKVFEFNDASMGLLESLGFTPEGVHREAAYVDGQYRDVHWFGVLADEWESPDA